MSTYHSDGSSVWRSHAISRYLCLSFLLTTFVTMLVVVWKTQDLLQNKPQNQPTKSFSTEKKIPNSRSACSAHLALKKKKKINPPTGCAQNRDIKKGFYVHLELFSTYYDWLLGKAICDSDQNFGRIFKGFQSYLLQWEMFNLVLESSRFLIWTADGFAYYLLKKTKTENAFVYKKELNCFSRKKENNCTI